MMRWLAQVAAVVIVLAAAAGTGWAEENENAVTIEGTVVVAKDDGGKVKAISVKTVDWDDNDQEITVVYQVNLDKKGLAIAKLNGKTVEVTGVIVNKGTAEKPNHWITVHNVREFNEEADDGEAVE